MSAEIVALPARTYSAQLFSAALSHLNVKVAGTLEGYLDFSVQPHRGPSLTYQLTCDDARVIAAHLLSAVDDVQRRCLYERDALLVEGAE